MISSLANFLMLVVYHGDYSARVSWTLLMYTMGAVAVARIAIEQNRNQSLLYLGGLAAAAFVVMAGLISRSPIFCAGILALIAYLSDRITRDCTLIDDDLDASGQGLIDFGTSAIKNEINKKTLAADGDGDEQAAVAQPSDSTAQPSDSTTQASDSTAQPSDSTAQASDSTAQAKPRNRKNSTHQPGRTVMYLALGALPLFGIGQFLMRSDQRTWSQAKLYLALYLFASLSLLVTTSFLGLRRYLRQRDVDMPGDVTVAWLAGGLVMIAGILGLAYVAPMPGSLLASIEMPTFLTSPTDRQASKNGWGDEAAGKSNPDAKTTQNDKNAGDKEVHSMAPKEGAPPGDSGDGKGEKGPTGKQKGGNKSGGDPSKDGKGPNQDSQAKDSQGKQKGQQKGKQQQSDQSKPKQSGSEKQTPNQNAKNADQNQQKNSQQSKRGDQPKADNQSKQSDSKSEKQRADNQANKQKQNPNDKKSGEKSDKQQQDKSEQQEREKQSDQNKQSKQDDQAKQKSENQNRNKNANQTKQSKKRADRKQDSQSQPSSPPPTSPGSNLVGKFFSMLGGLIKLIVMGALLVVVVVFAMRYRGALADWWNRLWNRDVAANEEHILGETSQADSSKPPRPFSSFRNPIGREKDPRKIIVITFQAFEAWMREHGLQRMKDETPHEFLRRVRGKIPNTATDANQIVEAYNRIVFGRGKATKRDMKAAQQVWQTMGA